MAEGIHQPPPQQTTQPLTLFRQEGAFAAAQPALAALFANADIEIRWANIHIAHDQHRAVLLQLVIQIALQVCVKFLFGREFCRMVAALALREVAVDHRDIAEGRGDLRHDDPALRFAVVTGEATTHRDRGLFGKQCHAVMPFLAMIKDVVAQLCDLFEREHIVVNLCLLQANHVRLVFLYNCRQLMGARTQPVDIKRNKFHIFCHIAISKSRC